MVHVEIGVWDWLRADWLDTYYPTDLPDDWRPAYYANDYACVGLPASMWRPEDLYTWGRETREELIFWLGCGPEQLSDPHMMHALEALGPRLEGVYFENASSDNMRAIVERFQGAQSTPRYAAELACPGVDLPWCYENAGGSATMSIYQPQPGDDIRKHRALLEAFAAAPGPAERCLLISGPPHIVEECRQLTMLLGI